MKKWILWVVTLCLLGGLLCGCQQEDKVLTTDQAQAAVQQYMGISASDATFHTHVTTYNGEACYSVYVTYNGQNWEYIVHAYTGEILAINNSNHSH